MIELKQGERVPLAGGGEAEIIGELGSGGQGAVYRARHGGADYALKWYRPARIGQPKAFRDNLERNIFDGAPNPGFLWPLRLTKEYRGAFGYLMRLRPEGYADFAAILNNEARFASLHAMIAAALNMAEAFRALHRQGKSYQDLNDGNFFINPETGDALICDNDNVAPDRTNMGIAGMPGYMAPEIVRGEARPDTLSDYHSLAVILFKLFIRHDPFMGKAFVEEACLTGEEERRLYGDNPVFIFDAEDESNRPVPGLHPNPLILWPVFPEYLREAFAGVFGRGAKSPGLRLTDNQWRDLLIRLRGETLACRCGHEFFLSHVRGATANGVFACPGCGEACSLPLRLEATGLPVYLFPGTKLYRCHTEGADASCHEETGLVVRNKKNPAAWGLRNTGKKAWRIAGAEKAVAPGSVVPLRVGMEIDFGGAKGRIDREGAE